MKFEYEITQGRRAGQFCSVLGQYRRCGIPMVKVVTKSGIQLHLRRKSLKFPLDKKFGVHHNTAR